METKSQCLIDLPFLRVRPAEGRAIVYWASNTDSKGANYEKKEANNHRSAPPAPIGVRGNRLWPLRIMQLERISYYQWPTAENIKFNLRSLQKLTTRLANLPVLGDASKSISTGQTYSVQFVKRLQLVCFGLEWCGCYDTP